MPQVNSLTTALLETNAFQHFTLQHNLKAHTKGILCLRFSPDGLLLGSGDHDGSVYIWNVHTGKLLQSLQYTVGGPVTDMVWATNPQDQVALFLGYADGCIRVCSFSSHPTNPLEILWEIQAHDTQIEMIAYDPFFRRLSTVGNGEIRLWSISQTCKFFINLYAFPSLFELGELESIRVEKAQQFIAKSVHFFSEGRCLLVGYLESHCL
ncbi:hypothetical protein M422DRAFT_177058 [Sphaerobolus stellatus SS14]|uniref:Anaphase-promoting complex subunit 4 WD40 domain-containing protein n=1 Tax=Sphaerobolus stellatus (strain SS14) TaxID=990650 RepID=A0A0C9U534_SPHS4|nr:hypothetical protein M422DRAFT_177058 [Sphaerobolus stellatus SS14]